MKRISLDRLLEGKQDLPYAEQAQEVLRQIEAGTIRPVKSSPRNGKKPALYMQYWIVEAPKDYAWVEEELVYLTYTGISYDYYRAHPEVYEKEREEVRRLCDFLSARKDALAVPVSLNERSFQIWGREKFLGQGNGRTVLRHCGLELQDLNVYQTAEPFASFTHSREVPQNLLVLENKDPFYSMRGHLLSGKDTILGVPVGTLVYGAGKRVVSSFAEFVLSAEPYMLEPGNTLLYFGDLDYEGILIYETLASSFQVEGLTLRPFAEAYRAMLRKGQMCPSLPETKEGQNRNIQNLFFSHFPKEEQREMKTLLESGRYIPQEILNRSDF